MAVAYDGGVVIGADSRTSTGIYISNRVSDKITKIDDRIFVCRSGSAADTQAISDYVTHFINQHKMEFGKPPSVKTAANFFRQLCYTNKEALMAGILVAGWDEKEGGQVYCIPVGGALVQQPFSIGGSGARSSSRRRSATRWRVTDRLVASSARCASTQRVRRRNLSRATSCPSAPSKVASGLRAANEDWKRGK